MIKNNFRKFRIYRNEKIGVRKRRTEKKTDQDEASTRGNADPIVRSQSAQKASGKSHLQAALQDSSYFEESESKF